MLQRDNKHNLVKSTDCYKPKTVRRAAYWNNSRKKTKIQKLVIFAYKLFGNQPRFLKTRISNWCIEPQNETQHLIIETAYSLLYNYIDFQDGSITRRPINPQLYQNMQLECNTILTTLNCPIKDFKEDLNFLISCQEEIIDYQEPRNKISSALAKFVFPLSIVVAIVIIFGDPSTPALRWISGIFVAAVPKFMEYKIESEDSNELIYEKTILKMLNKIELD
jgi:hypothetical protein